MVTQTNVDYLWNTVVNPRLGKAPYIFGGVFSSSDPTQGTDCSGAVAAELQALVLGPAMNWGNRFSTFTFEGATPGQTGPFGGVDYTSQLVCVASPSDVPANAAMTIAVYQNSDATQAHMICSVQGIDIEMGGNEFTPANVELDYHTNLTNSNSNVVTDTSTFNQWFYLPGPTSGAPLTYTVQTGDTLSSIATQLNLTLDELVSYNPTLITVGEVLNIAAPAPPPAPVPTPTPVATTALFYPDVSNNNWSNDLDLTNFLSQLHSEGFAGVCHKVSEGNYYSDPYWPTCRSWCESNDLSWLGYHYVTTDNADSQAAQWVSNNGGPFAMLDFEQGGGDLDNFWDVVNAFNAAGVNVTLAYIPNWYLNSPTGGGGDLSDLAANGIGLVSSAYPAGTGYASVIYQNAGGNTGTGWAAYNGGTPVVWQFTNQATVAGLSVDCNAYVGPDTTLDVLFTTGA